MPAFPFFVRRFAESSDILHCFCRISRKRGFDPPGERTARASKCKCAEV
jgi:hypothetical protein